jgi:hypothetical protein
MMHGTMNVKILKYRILRKSVLWEQSCSIRTDKQTDGQTDIAKLIVAFCNFVNAANNLIYSATAIFFVRYKKAQRHRQDVLFFLNQLKINTI